MIRFWRWWRALPQNPIYQREKGGWGQPNPIFTALNRFSPFIVLGALVLGACTGFASPALLTDGDQFAIFWYLLCLPGILLTMITLIASFLAPALTAPSISMERAHGSWDMLRVTPHSTRSIMGAKLFGALARLPIWTVLLLLSALQGVIWFFLAFTLDGRLPYFGVFLAFAVFLRPWLEIFYAALTGLFISTTITSATTALAISYAIILLTKLINSSGAWLLLGQAINSEATTSFLLSSSIGPTAVYAVGVIGFGAGIWYQSGQLEK